MLEETLEQLTHLEERLAVARRKNDSPSLDAEGTANVRGRIAQIKELLALALEGKIMSVGLVGCRKEGFFTAMSGRQAADLNLACDHLKAEILQTVGQTSAERASRRPIIRN